MRPVEIPGRRPDPPGAAGAARKPPVVALVAISAISPFAINAVLPSLPAIGAALGASYSRVQLVLSLFLAAVAVSQIFIGPISDRFGRRPVLLAGFAIFVAASAASAVAPSIEALLALRVIQGASGCVGIVLGRAIIRDLYGRAQSASMLGYVTMGLAIAPMLAPSVGGLMQGSFGWTAVFWLMAGMGVAAIAITWIYVPETNLAPTARLSFGSLLRDFLSLAGNRDFLAFTASSSLTSGVFFAFLGGAPYIAEEILGLTPVSYGLWFGTIAIGYSLGSFLSGRYAQRYGVTRMILAGSTLAVAAVAFSPALFALGADGSIALFVPMIVTGVSNGIVLPNALAGAISARPEIAGAASGLTGAAQLGMGAALATLAGLLLQGGQSVYPVFAVMSIAAVLGLVAAVLIRVRQP